MFYITVCRRVRYWNSCMVIMKRLVLDRDTEGNVTLAYLWCWLTTDRNLHQQRIDHVLCFCHSHSLFSRDVGVHCLWIRRERLLQADNIVTSTNVYLLRGVIELGRLLVKADKDVSTACMSAADVWHTYVSYRTTSSATLSRFTYFAD